MKTSLKWLGVVAMVAALIAALYMGMRVLNLPPGGGPVLHRAAQRGDLVLMRAMLVFGSDINSAPPPIGLTPLSLAASGGQIDAARLLLTLGADPNWGENQMDLPMTLACDNQDGEMVALLRKHGAKENIVHAILLGDNARVASMLKVDPGFALESGTPDLEEWAPIHYAAKAGNLEAIQILLRHGADPEVTTLIGQTVLDVAEPSMSDEIVEVLEAYRSLNAPSSEATC